MKKLLPQLLLSLLGISLSHAQDEGARYAIGEDLVWWDIDYRHSAEAPESKELPLISVEGNRFVDPEGKAVLFRGLSIADPDYLEHEGQWDRRLFEEVAKMGATLVRIPVHPAAWRRRGTDAYLALLDQAVLWATELNLHLIIDWHSIGNLKMELFQHPMYNTSFHETHEFWRTIARHFQGHNTIAFYEIFNEPTHYHGQLGRLTWPEWKQINEDIISVIRYYDKETIPLVAGFDWGYDLSHLRYNPLDVAGIGYVAHPYPNKRSRPWIPRWEENFAFAAERWPVIATELGFLVEEEGAVIDDNHYGNLITRFLESRGISWMAWVFHPVWYPQLLEDWDYRLTEEGEFFKKALHREPAEPLPAR